MPDYAVYVGFGDHEVEEIVIHGAKDAVDAAIMAADILVTEYAFGWHIIDIYPSRKVKHMNNRKTTQSPIFEQRHDFDDDSVCRKCGFDGAEWWHLERMKDKSDRQPQPPCTGRY